MSVRTLVSTVVVVLGGLVGLAGCGGGADDATVMAMFDNRYDPEILTVPTGAVVEFPNRGRVDHNVIDTAGGFDSREPSGVDQKPGETWSYMFSEPGTYHIYCSLHAVQNQDGEWEGMVATVTVSPAGD